MPLKYLPATEVKNRFGHVLREVTKTGGPIYVECDGKPVAVILSVREYERTRRVTLPIDEAELVHDAFGMLAERADIDDKWITEGRARWEIEWEDDQEN